MSEQQLYRVHDYPPGDDGRPRYGVLAPDGTWLESGGAPMWCPERSCMDALAHERNVAKGLAPKLKVGGRA